MLALLLLQTSLALNAGEIHVNSTSFRASIVGGSLASLRVADGDDLVRPPQNLRGVSMHRVQGDHWGKVDQQSAGNSSTELISGQTVTHDYESFAELDFGRVRVEYELETDTGDLMIRQQASAKQDGVWGVSWWIADIPLTYAILVPGTSGVRLTADAPGISHHYDYPLLWEAQFVVIEGQQGGFYVWAEDAVGRYKRLVVERHADGWRLGFYTINDAPFDRLADCHGVCWRLNTYRGDWRVAARRYRDWLHRQAGPVPIAEQRPSWVKDIRGCVIMPLDDRLLDKLPEYFDPQQTLLYLYDWRLPGYDRNYPDYEQMRPQLIPLMRRARESGFRVMLHVNYFGLDPLHPLYKQFERYQVRSPWGDHEKQWWVWPPENPDIRFAYINPACQAWRDLFTTAMVRLCQQTGADALHLDQTLCIYNDNNGRIDGMSMMEGNIALHQQLREALPDVALSGEGLNEITYRHEAFAQRHVWGFDHAKGTYDRNWLNAAHPISSYVLRPFTVIYGYLGCASPEDEHLYAAWNEAYRHWGVIPTLKPARSLFEKPGGFSRQFLEELRFWQQNRVNIDLDGPWPPEVAFPFRTADGRPFLATRDRRWICHDKEISRTITETTVVQGNGTIPGWVAFDEHCLLGLDPRQWYPYFLQPRGLDAFHICQLPDDMTIEYLAVGERVAVLKLRDATPRLADVTKLIEQADVGTRPMAGSPQTRRGPWESPDGGTFTISGDKLLAHPPWKNAGTGETFARLEWHVPIEKKVLFVSDVFLDPGAVGADKSDGVTFMVRASAGLQKLTQRFHQKESRPHRLELDLTPLCGREIELELAVHPGPNNNPSYDWARWSKPRIERQILQQAAIEFTGGSPWTLALDGMAQAGSGSLPIASEGHLQSFTAQMPGAICLLRDKPAVAMLPVQLSRDPDQVFVVLDPGRVVSSSQYAGIQLGSNQVGGVERNGLRAHPPNQGRVVAAYLMTLSEEPARFTSHVGLRDGSKSDGVRFAIEVNGIERAGRLVTPGAWESLEVDLSPWTQQPIVLSLVTDSAGPFSFDWAVWGEPRVVPAR